MSLNLKDLEKTQVAHIPVICFYYNGDMGTCKKCNKELFERNKNWGWVCRVCINEYGRSYQRDRTKSTMPRRGRPHGSSIVSKKQFLRSAKAKPCMDCGIQYPYYVMQFDHIRGTKIADISTMCKLPVSREQLQKEIEKCDLVCANCHSERTHIRRAVKMKALKRAD